MVLDRIKLYEGTLTKEDYIKEYSNKDNYNAPKFPLDIYPGSLQTLIKESHKYLGFPQDITASGIMFSISISMGNSLRLRNPVGYESKPNIWVVIVAPRGTAKSHPINKVTKPIRRYAGERFKKYEVALSLFDNKDEKLLSTSGVCKYLRISRRTLARLTASGEISYTKSGRKLLFKNSDIDSFLNNNMKK